MSPMMNKDLNNRKGLSHPLGLENQHHKRNLMLKRKIILKLPNLKGPVGHEEV